jgi:hypothetical protein
MHSTDIFDFTSLPPAYLDAALRNLAFDSECSPTHPAWCRIPRDLLPLRSRRLARSSEGRCRWYVIPAELAVAICQDIGGFDCGCDGDEPFARWLKARIAIRRHAMESKP